LIATWNIREFGTSKYGGRRSESYYYIAEIIARFDIVAVQEVRKNLAALKKLMSILGSHYEYLFTDVTEGKAGNEERLTFIFDTRKVRFGGLAGEMVLPPLERKDPNTGQIIVEPGKQLARTPFMCGFKAGWTNFVLTTVHILYGKAAAEDPNRLEEIRQLAKSMAKKANGKYEWSENIILLGDFNIFSPKDSTLKAITDEGFIIPKQLQSLKGSNVEKNKFYDQIAFKVRNDRFETSGKAGIFDFFKTVMTLEEEKEYAESMGASYEKDSKGKPRKNKTTYYKTYWRTFQMSDHLPMWVEVLIDHTDAYLKYKLLPEQKEDGDITAPSKDAKLKETKK
ncbi:MAG: endonuclease/exonuclease/phosphatase family protein, partial [Ginsengibacter sp.]